MDFSTADVPISRETWAPRSPRSPRRSDSRSDAPYVPPHARDGQDDRAGDYPRRSVSPAPPRKSFETAPRRPTNAPRVDPNPVLGVFGLSIRTRERDLEDEFSRFGEVERVVIVYDQRTDRSRGFGFITMRDTKDAAEAIEKLNGFNLHGRNIRVDYSATHKPHAPTPGQYMGEKRPVFEDRYGGRGGDRYDSRRSDDRRGGDRYGGDRYGRPDRYDDRRDDRRDNRPRRDYDDPYGGRSRRDDDRRRSPGPRRGRYSASPDRRAAAPRDYDAPAPRDYDAAPPASDSAPKY